MRKILLSGIIVFCFADLFGQKGNGYDFLIETKVYVGKDVEIRDDDGYHPCLYSGLSVQERDFFRRLIEERKKVFPGNYLNATDHFVLWYPLFMRFNYEDPYYRVVPRIGVNNRKFKVDDVCVVPINVVVINDSVVVSKSLDEQFRKGDRVIAVNDVPVERYLECFYKDRYVPFFVLQQYYGFAYSSYYRVEIERKGERLWIGTEGIGYGKARSLLRKGNFEERFFEENGTGYVTLNGFYGSGSKLVRRLSAFIRSAQKRGCGNVIIDLRESMEGNEGFLKDLVSIFTDREYIGYLRSKSVRSSEYVLNDYDFLKWNEVGGLYEVPEEEFCSSFQINPRRYLGDMNYYVLVSRNTAGTAASFVNMLQYNGLAILVGEPLAHNVLKYGDVVSVDWGGEGNIELFSTALKEEYTRSEDGQVYPDVEIDYVAKEFMEEEDPMVRKLLEFIKEKGR